MMINKKVYIVDDDKIALMLTEYNLQMVSSKIDISGFISSIELLDKFKNKEIEQPDVFIVDINMPILTGFEIIEALVKLPHFNNNMKIYIQSSSIRQSELEYVSQSKYINRHYEKYIMSEDLEIVLNE